MDHIACSETGPVSIAVKYVKWHVYHRTIKEKEVCGVQEWFNRASDTRQKHSIVIFIFSSYFAFNLYFFYEFLWEV